MVAARTKPAKKRTKPKASYHHGDLRRALLEAAIAILHEEGASALTLRSVARRAGVSHAAPKNHFADLAALLQAVAVVGFEDLTAAMRKAKARETDPLGSVLAIGDAYVRFALGSVGHFRAMFHPALGDRAPGSALDEASRVTFDVLASSIAEAQAANVVRAGETQELSLAAWSLVHGLATLAVDRHLERKGFTSSPTQLAQAICQHLYVGLRA